MDTLVRLDSDYLKAYAVDMFMYTYGLWVIGLGLVLAANACGIVLTPWQAREVWGCVVVACATYAVYRR